MSRSGRMHGRAARGVAGLFLAAGLAAAVSVMAAPVSAPAKFEPRLLSVVLADSAAPLSAWVTFADKGETGPGDLARRLAEAAAALDPHARSRRERADVRPLVDYLDLPVHAPYVEALRASGCAPYGASRWFNRVAVRAPAARLVALAGQPWVVRLSAVERGEPLRDEPVAPLAEPRRAEPAAVRAGAALDYGVAAAQLAQIGVPALHDSGYTGAGVRVCVLDDGFNHHDDHPALAGADILLTRDFVRGVTDPTDLSHPAWFSHGTRTLGCVAGYQPGRYVGAAPGATFLLGRTEDSSSEHAVEMVYWGMGAEWADSAGADIISSSLGYNYFDWPDTSLTVAVLDGHTSVISRAAEIAASKGILVVNSAGNSGNDPGWRYVLVPADVDGDSLIAAGAVDANGLIATFSSWGPTADGRIKPDLVARGVSVWCADAADVGWSSLFNDGTSFACPLVAGLAACLMQARPAWSPRTLIRALRLTASRATQPDDRYGFGLPDGEAALRWIPDTAWVPPEVGVGSVGLWLTGANPIRASAPWTQIRFVVGPGLDFAPRLRVYDAQGRRVVHALSYQLTGVDDRGGRQYAARWDGRGDDGRLLDAGLYFVSLAAGGRRTTLRVVSLR